MAEVNPLSPDALYRKCDIKKLKFKTSADLETLTEPIGQERAVAAIQFAMGIRHHGYNLFVFGPTGMGKHRFVRRFLEKKAKQDPSSYDWCYVNNFDETNTPRAIRLPAGTAVEFRAAMASLVEDLKVTIPAAFESEDYQARKEAIEKEFEALKVDMFKEVQAEAEGKNLVVMRTAIGLMFLPKVDGEVVSPDAFDDLPADQREVFQQEIEALQEKLQNNLQQRPHCERDQRERLRDLNRAVTSLTVGALLSPTMKRFKDEPDALAYLEGVHKDVAENVEGFIENIVRGLAQNPEIEDGPESILRSVLKQSDGMLQRYGVNVLVDGSKTEGAPIVYEDNPTLANLLGRLEYRSEMGTLTTDFSLIRAGALHRANGGYLILEGNKVFQQPLAWEALKRAIRSNEIRIESADQFVGLIHTKALTPTPIPLNVQVVLLGEPWLYSFLAHHDPDIDDLFKVAAEFEQDIVREDNPLMYARLLATLARSDDLRPFDRPALGRVIEHASRLAEDVEKLSTHMDSIVSLLRESDFFASQNEHDLVGKGDVQEAIDAKSFRLGRSKDKIQETILRDTFLIDTAGKEIGQINGLSVMQLANYSFGRPTRITAQVRLGKGDVLDIEREVELGGAIHSKGVLILHGFLGARFARKYPLAFSATLVFEQSYGGVDGDSASMAELCVLMSAIAQIPIKQSLAITGSVNQHGQAQAVGGVNEKIEGYFDICKARGLDGSQGVIIPKSTTKFLMLRQDIVKASKAGKFQIYAVQDVDEAIALLADLPAGEIDDEGVFPEGSFNRAVADKLADLAQAARNFASPPKDSN